VLGQRDCETESQRIYQEELVKLEKRFENIEFKKMVAKSNNETRLEKMKKRNECLESLKTMSINKLQS
jgi:hypothetical protein